MHDKNGKPLKIGDRVRMEAVITEGHAGEDYCNATIESVEPRRPDGLKERCTLNTGVLEKVE